MQQRRTSIVSAQQSLIPRLDPNARCSKQTASEDSEKAQQEEVEDMDDLDVKTTLETRACCEYYIERLNTAQASPNFDAEDSAEASAPNQSISTSYRQLAHLSTVVKPLPTRALRH